MAEYTPEQVEKQASLLSDTWGVGEAYKMLRAYAATLRQQAFSQFANPEALADWLDALHECHADGSVGNRKWEAAQVAARAIRSLNEPSGNSGQLRQQAGRVDEGRGAELAFLAGVRWADSHPRDIWHASLPNESRDDAARRESKRHAAKQGNVVVTRDEVGRIVAVTRQDDDGRVLRVIAENPQWIAQNTQGDGAPAACNVGGSWLWCKLMDWCKKRRVPPAEYNDLFDIAGEAHKLYHAERARVPAEMDPFASQPEGLNYADGWNACRESMLAAAPSQRAEVK